MEKSTKGGRGGPNTKEGLERVVQKTGLTITCKLDDGGARDGGTGPLYQKTGALDRQQQQQQELSSVSRAVRLPVQHYNKEKKPRGARQEQRRRRRPTPPAAGRSSLVWCLQNAKQFRKCLPHMPFQWKLPLQTNQWNSSQTSVDRHLQSKSMVAVQYSSSSVATKR